MQAKIYLALAGRLVTLLTLRNRRGTKPIFSLQVTGSRTVPPRASQNLVLFCLNTRWFSVVSACTTQIRVIFFIVPACITFASWRGRRFDARRAQKKIFLRPCTVPLRLFQCRLCALAFQNILPPPWLVHAVEFCSHILWAHGDFIQCLTRMSANCKGSEFVN